MNVKSFRSSLFQIDDRHARGVAAHPHIIDDSKHHTTMALPVGALAFPLDDTRQTPRLPSGITLRGWVDASGDATVWLAHTFRVDQPTSIHYFAPRRKMQTPPGYRAGILYPPRAMVEHRGEIYQNGKNCDVHTRPTHRADWVHLGSIQDIASFHAPWICSDCIGFAVEVDAAAPAAIIQECTGHNSNSTNTQPRPDALTCHHAKDDTYRFDFQDVGEAPTDVTVVWTLHNRAPEQIAILLPAMCPGAGKECSIKVHLDVMGQETCRTGENRVPVNVEQLRRHLQLPRIQVGRHVMWHHAPLRAYHHDMSGEGVPRPVPTQQVHQQLGSELFDTVQVVALDPSPRRQSIGQGKIAGSSCFTWQLRARGAAVRTELHARYALPALPGCCCMRLPEPYQITLTQLHFPTAQKAKLLVRHGRVLGINWDAPTHNALRGATTQPEEWYSYATSYECIPVPKNATNLVLWVVHAQDDPEPATQWVPDTWTTQELDQEEKTTATDSDEEEWDGAAIPCHAAAKTQRSECHRQRHNQNRMAAEILADPKGGAMAALMMYAMRGMDKPWKALARQLALQWRLGGMAPYTSDIPLLARVLQCLARLSGIALSPGDETRGAVASSIQREQCVPPPTPYHTEKENAYTGILSPEIAQVGLQGNCSLDQVRGHPYAQHLGPHRQALRNALTQEMLEVPCSNAADLGGDVDTHCPIQQCLSRTYNHDDSDA